MGKCGKFDTQQLLLLSALVSLQIAQGLTEEQLSLLAAFFTVLGDNLELLATPIPSCPPCPCPATEKEAEKT